MMYRFLIMFVIVGTIMTIIVSLFNKVTKNNIIKNPRRMQDRIWQQAEMIWQQAEMKAIKLQLPDGGYEYYKYLIVPRLDPKTNKARTGHATCIPEKNSTNSTELGIIVITDYFPVNLLRQTHHIYGKRQATDDEEEARRAEIVSSIQGNLNHPYVKAMHIFVEFYQSMVYLNGLNLKNSEKLVIQWTNKTITVEKTLKYIHKCLQGHIVALMNQDIRLGEGFDKVHPSTLIDNKLMYALTRYPAYESYCFHTWHNAYCHLKYNIGSLDAYIFHVKEFSQEPLKLLSNVGKHNYGMENLLVWVFEKKLGYKVTNPCLVLQVHHEHCVPIRKLVRTRVNLKHSSSPGISDKLI